jgi:uncharacterized protein YdbL (DUF1318 family)
MKNRTFYLNKKAVSRNAATPQRNTLHFKAYFKDFRRVVASLREYAFPIVAVAVLLQASACTLAKVDVNVVSERTSLENQVLGTYNSLSQDMLLVASVRGVSPSGKIEALPRHTPEQLDATRALETIAFHADDVETFKKFGWIGENNEGLLTPFTRETPKVTSEELKSFAANYSAAEFQQVLQEVNQAREVLMKRVVQTNENFTIKDLPAIRTVFAKINRQNSAPGAKVQEADGRWLTNLTTPQPPP